MHSFCRARVQFFFDVVYVYMESPAKSKRTELATIQVALDTAMRQKLGQVTLSISADSVNEVMVRGCINISR